MVPLLPPPKTGSTINLYVAVNSINRICHKECVTIIAKVSRFVNYSPRKTLLFFSVSKVKV